MCAVMRKRSAMLVSALAVAAWAAGPVRGEDWNHYWVNNSGHFDHATNWWCVETGTCWAHYPYETNGARFGYWGWAPGTVLFTQSHTNAYMTVGDGAATFDLSGHTYALTWPVGVGTGFGINVGDTTGFTASLNVVGGTLSAVASCLGYVLGASGEGDVSAGATWQSDYLHVGWWGGGSLTVREGSRLVSTVGCLGTFAGSSGSVTLGHPSDFSYSTWSVQGDLFVGGSDTAAGGYGEVFLHMTGELQVGGTLKLWDNSKLDLAGGLVTTRSLVCAPGATLQHSMGWLRVEGGTYDPGVSHLMVDGFGGPELSLKAATQAGTLSEVTVGDSQGGSLTVRAGTVLTNTGDAWVGRSVGSSGLVTVQGGGSRWSPGGRIHVGEEGTGELTIRDGGAVTCANVTVGNRSSSEGTVTVDGADSTLTVGSSLSIAPNGGTGELTVSNGGAVGTGTAYIGSWVESNGTVTLSGAESSLPPPAS